MIAYNKEQLDNREMIAEAELAFKKQCLTAEELQNIKAAHPVNLYTPNMSLRIGLFLLTLVISIFSFGFLCLILLSGFTERVFGGICIFFAIAAYWVLELLVKDKKHYKSGADTALMWISGSCLIGGIMVIADGKMGPLSMGILTFIFATWFVLRFADLVMAWVAQLALLFCICDIFVSFSLALPFMMIGVSFGMYYLLRQLIKQEEFRHYKFCMQGMQVLALLTLYTGGNYFIVREVNVNYFGMGGLPLGWIFWALTVLVPLTYLYLGIRNKDSLLLRTGLMLIAAMVFTIRYYHSIAPIEVAMTIGGLIMIGLAYGIIRYLKEPKKGFTSEETDDKNAFEAMQIESLVISQTFKGGAPQKDHFNFGGGTASGGGASGDY